MKHKLYYKILSISTISLLILLLFMLGGYIWTFHNGLSENHQTWGEFGNFFGSITGLLAFIGVLYTIRQGKTQEERNIFFQLLNMFQNKVNEIQYYSDDKKIDTPIHGLKAFYYYSNDIKKYYILSLLIQRIKIIDNEDSILEKKSKKYITPERYNDLLEQIKKVLPLIYKASGKNTFQELKEHIIHIEEYEEAFIHSLSNKICYSSLVYLGYILTEQLLASKNYFEIHLAMNRSSNLLYEHSQHQLGQYFRNVYYILNIIHPFKNNKIFSKIFRAQLSRYELIIILFNATSKHSSCIAIEQLKKYDIFNNLCPNDVNLYHATNRQQVEELIGNVLEINFKLLEINSLSPRN